HPGQELPENIDLPLVLTRGVESKSELGRLVQQWRDQPGAGPRRGPFAQQREAMYGRYVARQQMVNEEIRRLIREEPAVAEQMPKLFVGKHAEAALKGWDQLNAAAKLPLIYGKVGYIPANLLGNVGLNLIQQGFFALPNLAKSAALHRTLGKDLTGKIDRIIGSGVAHAIIGQRKGLEAGAGRVADVLGTITDRYTRRASFLHEARRSGYRTKGQLTRLLPDAKLENELIDVTRRARDAAVEYEFLGPNEKAWMRRLIFVYPWVKGATRFAGQFPREHPGQLAIGAQLSKQAAAQQMQDLAPVPAKHAGIIKGRGTPDRPLIVDPRGAASIQTPAQVRP